jgi:hypothetical protein
VERPLDTNEWLFALYNDLGAYRTAMAAVVEGPVTETLLREAMAKVQDRHPLLRARIAGGLAEPRWVPAERHEVALKVLEADATTSLERLTEDDLHQPYDPAREPLWRCTWARRPGNGPHLLVVGMHHSVADGLSGLNIFTDLIATCASIRQGTPRLPNLPAGQPLDAVLGVTTLSQRVQGGIRKLRAAFSPRPSPPPPLEANAPPERRRTRVLFRELSPGALAALLARARAEKATIAGALTSAFLEACRAKLQPVECVVLHHPVNLRGNAIPREQVGTFAGNVSTTHVFRTPTPFWQAARQASRELREQVQSGSALVGARWNRGRVATVADDLRRLQADPASSGREGFLSMSSRGTWPDPSAGPFRVRSLYPATSNHGLGNQFQSSCGTVGDSLFCSVVFVEPLHSEATGRAVADAFLDSLEREAGTAASG